MKKKLYVFLVFLIFSFLVADQNQKIEKSQIRKIKKLAKKIGYEDKILNQWLKKKYKRSQL